MMDLKNKVDLANTSINSLLQTLQTLLDNNTKVENDELLKECLILFLEVRKIHRFACLELRQMNQKLLSRIDSYEQKALYYEALTYQRNSLESDIKSLREQRFVYKEIELSPVNQFLADNPELVETNDNYLLTVGRLNHELALRQRLITEKSVLNKRLEGLKAKKSIRQEYLARLLNQVNTFVRSADILSEAIGVNPSTQ